MPYSPPLTSLPPGNWASRCLLGGRHLADAHTHPGAAAPGEPLDEAVLREDLREHVAAGVTLIRAPGLAGDPPGWFGRDDDGPRALHAGPWIAQPGQFFDGWGRRAGPAELPALAAAQAAQTGWAKVIADWHPGDDVIPVGVLRQVVAAVHAVGGPGGGAFPARRGRRGGGRGWRGLPGARDGPGLTRPQAGHRPRYRASALPGVRATGRPRYRTSPGCCTPSEKRALPAPSTSASRTLSSGAGRLRRDEDARPLSLEHLIARAGLGNGLDLERARSLRLRYGG